jgi:DNA-binding NarL/FixJ family response regulator
MKTEPDEPKSSPCKRVLLVDDHPLMREGIALWIKRSPGLDVCGQASSAREALGSIGKLKPDMILTDLSLSGGSGLDLVKDIRAIDPGLPVLVVSMHDELNYAERSIRAGARGYVMKESGGEKLIEAIQTVLRGHVYVSEKMAATIVDNLTSNKPRGSRSPLAQLSDREFEVFELNGSGLNTHDIAKRLNVSPKTADVHRRNIREKLKIKDLTELIRHAVRWTEAHSADKQIARETMKSGKRTKARRRVASKKKSRRQSRPAAKPGGQRFAGQQYESRRRAERPGP